MVSLKLFIVLIAALKLSNVNCIPVPPYYPPAGSSYQQGPPVYGANYQHQGYQQSYQEPYHQGQQLYQQPHASQYGPQSYEAAYQPEPACLQYYCYRFEMPNVTVTTSPAPPVAASPSLQFQNLFQQQQEFQSHFQNPFLQPGGRMPGSSGGPQYFVSPEARQATPAPATGCGRRLYFFCSAVSVSGAGGYQPIAACPSYLCSIPTTVTTPTGCDPFTCQIVE